MEQVCYSDPHSTSKTAVSGQNNKSDIIKI